MDPIKGVCVCVCVYIYLAQPAREPVIVPLATVLVAASGDLARDLVPVDFLGFARGCWGRHR
jgi:hypothetical protein